MPLIEFLLRIYRAKIGESDAAYILNMRGYLLDMSYYAPTNTGTYGTAPRIPNTTWRIELNSHTLAGGTLANSDVVAATASQKLYLLWVIWNWDTAPAAAYTFAWQEEDQANDRWSVAAPLTNGDKKYMFYYTTAADNKGIQVDIGGGAGAEVLNSIACYGYI